MIQNSLICKLINVQAKGIKKAVTEDVIMKFLKPILIPIQTKKRKMSKGCNFRNVVDAAHVHKRLIRELG